jgi:putative DNA primase/helicase
MPTNPLLQSAIAYAARGWRVHPLKPRDKTPITKNGCKDATLDEATIRRWWSQWPSANVGLATGWEFFVLDIDTKSGGMAWLEANELPTTHEATTGSGGKHLLYRMPAGVIVQNSAGLIAPGVDVRGVGGYIVAAPSVHPNGTPYTWLDCDDVPEGSCADAPIWLLDMCLKITKTTAQRFDLPDVIAEGGRDNTLYKFACSLRSKTPMTQGEVRAALEAANQRCVPPLTSADLDRIAASASRHPNGLSPEYAAKKRTAPPADPPDEAPEDETTDDGSGKAKLHPNTIAENILKDNPVINVDGHLYEYIGTHWDLISPERLKAMARQYDSPRWTSQKRRSEVASYIQATTHRSKQTWRNLEKFEIPLSNGVIDIRSMSLRPHRQDDYLQACIPHEYDSSATCPVWQECLDTYFGADPDSEAKKNAMQEFFGYCLMPHATYKKALLCKGESDSGKSTIPYLLRILVGQQNACAVGVEDMDDSRKRAPLRGKLVNLLTELTSDAMIADGGFKTLVSTEEPILFDEKFLPAVLDVPIAKHVIVTNVLPTINDRSRGTFNRLLMISFNHVIPIAQQDRAIWDKLRFEIKGILHWALYGAQRLYHNRGTFTSVGAVEIEEYRAGQNPVLEWIAEACEVDESGRALLSDMRERYGKWAGRPVTPQYFALCLQSGGFQTTKNPVFVGGKKGRACVGLRIS